MGTILHARFRSKIDIREITTAVGGDFSKDFSVLSQNRAISGNLNYYQRRNHFQTISDIVFGHLLCFSATSKSLVCHK